MAEILISNQAWSKPQFKQLCSEALILHALRYGGKSRNIHVLSSALDNIVGISDVMITLHDTPVAVQEQGFCPLAISTLHRYCQASPYYRA